MNNRNSQTSLAANSREVILDMRKDEHVTGFNPAKLRKAYLHNLSALAKLLWVSRQMETAVNKNGAPERRVARRKAYSFFKRIIHSLFLNGRNTSNAGVSL